MLVVGFGALCLRTTITVNRCMKYNEERDRPDTGVFFRLVFFFFFRVNCNLVPETSC